MSAETHPHLIKYRQDAEALIKIIAVNDMEDIVQKNATKGPEYANKVLETVAHIKQLQFLCISSCYSSSGTKDGAVQYVYQYLSSEQDGFGKLDSRIKWFFEQFVRPDHPPPAVTLELYTLFCIVDQHHVLCKDIEKSKKFRSLLNINKVKDDLINDVLIWKLDMEQRPNDDELKALGKTYKKLAERLIRLQGKETNEELEKVKTDVENALETKAH